MAIEFRCSQCSQLLRVPDDSAGKNARCPKCQSLMTVPAVSQPAATQPAAPLAQVPGPAQPPKPAADPFAFLNQPGGGAGGAMPPPPTNPFAGLGTPPPPKPAGNPFGDGGASPASANPYASPAGGYAYQPAAFAAPGGPITNVVVPLDPIMSHAWRVWQANLGLLAGVWAIEIGIVLAIAIPFGIAQGILEHNGEHELEIAVRLLGDFVSNMIQLYLGIGQAQISLKLVRGMPATIGDMFGGGPLFLSVFLAGLIAGIALLAGTALCIVPAILLALWFWPYYWLLVEQKAGIVESFSLASKITEGNRGTAFVLALCSIGIMLLGCLAVCIGVIFAAPLVSLMWATAYLMMSGQLPSQPQYARY